MLEAGEDLRAAYAPDATTGTRWFADLMTWVRVPDAPDTERLLPTPLALEPLFPRVRYSDAR